MRGKKRIVPALVVLFCGAAVLAGFYWYRTERQPVSYESSDFAMGTYIQQTVYGKNGEEAAKAALGKITRLENEISWRIDTSDVARLNAAAGTDWISIDPETASILSASLDVAQKSDGAYDPTILPVSSLWDFGGENQHAPAKSEVQKFVQYVNYQDLRVDAKNSKASLKLHYMAIDLGGIGKGAACDDAIAAYRSAGAEYGIIAVGGSIGVYGSKPDGSPWHIAIRDPDTKDDSAGSMGQIDLASGFVSTSGTYEQTFTENGVTYHHLLNPKTGYPENNGLVSVTVKCDNGALSDALSTACFVLGREKGEKLLADYHAEGVFIDSANQVYVTGGLKDSFQITGGNYVLAK
ncbi:MULTISPECIES: FAD:protein FMN transferase [Acutalibacteraceae]|uniref:FAD:protein FMN transferase n=1 Tax=Acutalibacteraceae TaxID=3082771 RepID=UPI0013E8C217|nr:MULTISPECIES: FAD:protein FMN transferase [Acutalibacteraceae]